MRILATSDCIIGNTIITYDAYASKRHSIYVDTYNVAISVVSLKYVYEVSTPLIKRPATGHHSEPVLSISHRYILFI